MNKPLPGRCKQQGVMLLEALISILIFSIGILAIIGLQAASIKMSSDAKYRSDASLLAGQYVSSMWSELAIDPMAAASSAAAAGGCASGNMGSGGFCESTVPQYDSAAFAGFATGGAQFNTWLTEVQATLPDATAEAIINTDITCDYSPCSGVIFSGTQQEIRAIADITITWKLPGTSAERHTFRTSAQVTAQKQL